MNDLIVCKEIRKDITITACTASIAHIASSFSIVEILYVLYLKNVIKIDIKNPYDENREKLILSKGHGSLALYVTLYKKGFFNRDTLMSFAKPNSNLGGEPVVNSIPGIEATTGSLGHGLSIAVGIALANKLDRKDLKTYVIIGDGECEEGTMWEALFFAAKEKLDNLVIILDNNRIQKMDYVVNVMGIENWKDRFESFGLFVKEIDGHNIEEIELVLREENVSGKPLLIIANTIKGKGVSIVENNPRWHFRLPNKKEKKIFMEELEIKEEEFL